MRGLTTTLTLAGLALAVVAGSRAAARRDDAGGAALAAAGRPSVLVISVDTLRLDRLSASGYHRPTSPNIDRLLREGAQFTQARTVEPLTSPALCSMWSSLYPHEHGSTRNGLRMRPAIDSLPKRLRAAGWRTAAFVGSWTLRDKLSGLGEHFGEYEEVLTRNRWLGLITREANGSDLTASATAWLAGHARHEPGRPFLLWVHYVEPHAPYRTYPEHAERLGLGRRSSYTAPDRYDMEIAAVDASIGRLVEGLAAAGLDRNTIVVFASDHGESLGEHQYWGHGRHLYESGLRIPMSITWRGRVRPQTIAAPALNLDLAPTLASLLGIGHPHGSRGFDWTAVLDGADAPVGRQTTHQAHRGVVLSNHDSKAARRTGLLEVAVVRPQRKEIFRVEDNRLRVFDLVADPTEQQNLARGGAQPSEQLQDWLRDVFGGLHDLDDSPVEAIDTESLEALRSLGYVE
jgi:arylsulfatase A-like enzyme